MSILHRVWHSGKTRSFLLFNFLLQSFSVFAISRLVMSKPARTQFMSFYIPAAFCKSDIEKCMKLITSTFSIASRAAFDVRHAVVTIAWLFYCVCKTRVTSRIRRCSNWTVAGLSLAKFCIHSKRNCSLNQPPFSWSASFRVVTCRR